MAFASQVNVELQAHWVLPRWPSHRAPHDWQKYMRPRAKVQGVWVYFIEVTFFIADPVMPHDSSMIVEVIAQCLERVDEICRERNIARPTEFVLWTDNTSRENKNSTMMAYLAHLVSKGMFTCASLMNLPKGHTHNILDQLFGVISRAMKTVHTLRDLDELAEQSESFLQRPALREWFGPDTRVRCKLLLSVRNWTAFYEQLHISYEGGMRWDVTATHCVSAMVRHTG